jgi:hypothetical protein
MGDLGDMIRSRLHIEGYSEIHVEPLKGPVVLVTVNGAAEDTTAARHAREQLDAVMTESTKAHAADWADFRNSISSSNKGEDLVVKCEVIFP